MRSAMVFSVLKRKCGSTCVRRAFELRLGEQPAQALFAQQQRALLGFEAHGVEAMFELCADGFEEGELGLHERACFVRGG